MKARAVVNKLIFQGFFNIHTADNCLFGLFFFHRLTVCSPLLRGVRAALWANTLRHRVAEQIKLNRLIVIIVKFSFGDFLKIFVLGGSFGDNIIGNGGRSVVCFLNLRLLCLAFNLRNKSLCLFGNGDIACVCERGIVHNRRECAVLCAKHRTVVVFVIPNMESNRNGIYSHRVALVGGVELFGVRIGFIEIGNGVMLVYVKPDFSKINLAERCNGNIRRFFRSLCLFLLLSVLPVKFFVAVKLLPCGGYQSFTERFPRVSYLKAAFGAESHSSVGLFGRYINITYTVGRGKLIEFDMRHIAIDFLCQLRTNILAVIKSSGQTLKLI